MGHECSDCKFAPDSGAILTFFVPRELRDLAGNKPVFVGKFTMGGCTRPSGFYLFRCPDCGDTCIDYPHGYRSNGRLYIQCDRGRVEIILPPGKYKDVYKREKVVAPPTFWEELKSLWKLKKRGAFKT